MTYLFFIFLSFKAVASYDEALKLSRLKDGLALRENTWAYGFTLIQNDPKYLPTDYLTIRDYALLSSKRKDDLRRSSVKIKPLEALTDSDRFLDDERNASELEDRLVKKYSFQGKIKDLFRAHFQSTPELDPELLDRSLGIDYKRTEQGISKYLPLSALVDVRKLSTQSWYGEIREAFKIAPLAKGDVFYDLGSGYGRPLFYGASLFPDAKFKGVEIVSERVDACNEIKKKHRFKNAFFFAQDVLKHDFSDGTHFYLFNPFPAIMPEVLGRLEKLAKKKKIRIITLWEPGDVLLHAQWLKLIGESYVNRHIRVFESK